jgi:hypothetical protein
MPQTGSVAAFCKCVCFVEQQLLSAFAAEELEE